MTADVSYLIQHLAEHSHAPEQVAGPPCSLHNQNIDCENCLTKPCTSDTSTFSTPCKDANLTAESSVSIEPCRTYTPLSTNVCRIATANHRTDMTTQRSGAALIRDVSQVSVGLFESLCRTSVSLELWLDANGAFDARLESP